VYAKLIAGSAVGSKKNYAFMMYTFNKLRKAKLKPSAILRKNKILVELPIELNTSWLSKILLSMLVSYLDKVSHPNALDYWCE